MAIRGRASDTLYGQDYGIGADPLSQVVYGGNPLASQNVGVMQGSTGANVPEMNLLASAGEAPSLYLGGRERPDMEDILKSLKGLPAKEKGAAAAGLDLSSLTEPELLDMKKAHDSWEKQASEYKPPGKGLFKLLGEHFTARLSPGRYANEMQKRRALDPNFPEYWHMRELGAEVAKQLDLIRLSRESQKAGAENAAAYGARREAALTPGFYGAREPQPAEVAQLNPSWNRSPIPELANQFNPYAPPPVAPGGLALNAPMTSTPANANIPGASPLFEQIVRGMQQQPNAPFQYPPVEQTNLEAPVAAAIRSGRADLGEVLPLVDDLKRKGFALSELSRDPANLAKPEYEKLSGEYRDTMMILNAVLAGNKGFASRQYSPQAWNSIRDEMRLKAEWGAKGGDAAKNALLESSKLHPYSDQKDWPLIENFLTNVARGAEIPQDDPGRLAYYRAESSRVTLEDFDAKVKRYEDLVARKAPSDVTDPLKAELDRERASNALIKNAYSEARWRGLGITPPAEVTEGKPRSTVGAAARSMGDLFWEGLTKSPQAAGEILRDVFTPGAPRSFTFDEWTRMTPEAQKYWQSRGATVNTAAPPLMKSH